jgi:hypothetical protein
VVPLLAHHELAASLGAYALGLSGASVAVLWKLATGPAAARLQRRAPRPRDGDGRPDRSGRLVVRSAAPSAASDAAGGSDGWSDGP